MYMLLSYVLTLSQMFPQNVQTHKSTDLFKLMMLRLSRRESESKGGGWESESESKLNVKSEGEKKEIM